MSPNFQARGTTAPTVALSMRQVAHIREEINKSPLAASIFIAPTTKEMVVRDLESLFQQLYHADLPEPSIKDSGLNNALPALALETQLAFHQVLAMHHTDVATWHKVVTKDIRASAAAQDAAFEHSAKYDAVHDAAHLMGITIDDGNVGNIAVAFDAARTDGKSDWCVAGMNRYMEVTESINAALSTPAQEAVKPAPVLHSAHDARNTEHDNDAEADQPALF